MKLFEMKYNIWLFLGVLMACFAVSAGVRYQQFETWKENPPAYFVGERPMMTTLDAPHWLRLAREYNEGVILQKKGLQRYPDSTEIFKESKNFVTQKFVDPQKTSSTFGTREIDYRSVPLLSLAIAHLASFFNYNYYLTGTLLIPVFASLFILPLGIYFFRIGLPVSGLLGGLVGTFASGYYMRSSIGRIDTDMLNLFFPVLVGLLILLTGKAKTERNVLLYSMGAGLSLFLFQWWYGQSGFTLAYFMVLVFSLFVQQIRFRTILVGTFLFVLCVQPGTFMDGTGSVRGQFNKYFVIEEAKVKIGTNEIVIDDGNTPASFPNTLTTISEVDHVPMEEILQRVLSNTALDWIGFLSLFGMAVFKWRVLLPLVPMLALGLLSFQSSNRFIMYLAPFVGIGLGWLLQLGIEGVFLLTTKNIDHSDVNDRGKRKKVKG
jgi:dolichyl-diphosphooligosaccharide--protein glycosyltransferase